MLRCTKIKFSLHLGESHRFSSGSLHNNLPNLTHSPAALLAAGSGCCGSDTVIRTSLVRLPRLAALAAGETPTTAWPSPPPTPPPPPPPSALLSPFPLLALAVCLSFFRSRASKLTKICLFFLDAVNKERGVLPVENTKYVMSKKDLSFPTTCAAVATPVRAQSPWRAAPSTGNPPTSSSTPVRARDRGTAAAVAAAAAGGCRGTPCWTGRR